MNKWMRECLLTVCLLPVTLPVFADSSSSADASYFEDLKTFLGATNAADIQAANVLLYMLPPFFDVTTNTVYQMALGTPPSETIHKKKLRELANYNVMTKPGVDPDKDLLAARVKNCLTADGKAATYCDYMSNSGSGDDVLADTLFAKGYSDTQDQNALQYIKNLSNYQPMAYIGDSLAFTNGDRKQPMTPAGMDYFQKAYKAESLMSMVQNSLVAIYADRTRILNSLQGLPVGEKGVASLMEMLSYDVDRRYMNQNWYTQMNQASEAALLREIANMLALQNYIQFKQYEQGSRIEALLATQVIETHKSISAQDRQPAMNTQGVIRAASPG